MDLSNTTGYVPGFADELNLRELGGLPTNDGRHVRRGLFFRGSSLVDLSAEERMRVDELDLRYLLDLRAVGEVEGKPDYVPAGCAYERIGGMRYEDGTEVDFSPGAIERFFKMEGGIKSPEHFMESLYVGMAFANPAVHALVEHVVAGETPVYFHCTAGKDRTGVCALVVCLLLGVTREAIFEDFMLTNEYRRSIIESVAEMMPDGTPPEEIERWKKANGVQAESLQAVFDAIEERCGSVDAYLSQEYGLDAAALADLRDCYLA